MPGKEDIHCYCDACGNPIRFGNAMVTINRNIEQVNRDPESGQETITVIESECLTTVCAECGNQLVVETSS